MTERAGPPDGGSQSLRRRSAAGGRSLAVREVLGLGVRTLGLLLLVRLLGPGRYGVFAGSALVLAFLTAVATFGADVFLTRHAEPLADIWYQRVGSLLAVTSSAVAVGAVVAALVARQLLGEPAVVRPFCVLAATIPVNLAWIPGRVRLERSLQFGRLARVELGGDLVQYAVAVTLALAGAGYWAPVAGVWACQCWQLTGVTVATRHGPGSARWRLDRRAAREIVSFGWAQAGTLTANRARDTLVPLVLGSLAGSAAVGVAALALRLADSLAFANRAGWRVALVVLGRVQRDLPRLRRATRAGITLQVLAVGTPLAVFAVVASVAVPHLLGPEWVALAAVFPFVAFNQLVLAGSTTQIATLVVVGRNRTVLATAVADLALAFAAALVLVPPFGLTGWAVAGTVGLVSQVAVHRSAARAAGGRLVEKSALVAFLVLLPVLAAPRIPGAWGPSTLAVPVAALTVPAVRRGLGRAVAAGLGRPGATSRRGDRRGPSR